MSQSRCTGQTSSSPRSCRWPPSQYGIHHSPPPCGRDPETELTDPGSSACPALLLPGYQSWKLGPRSLKQDRVSKDFLSGSERRKFSCSRTYKQRRTPKGLVAKEKTVW